MGVNIIGFSIDITENGLHYMFKNNSFRFDVIDKISAYFDVDISYFSDSNSISNTQNLASPRSKNETYKNKIELNNAFETSQKAEKVKKGIEADEFVGEYLKDLTVSTLCIELFSLYLEKGVYSGYKNLFEKMLLDIDKGINLETISEKYNSEILELIETSIVKKESLSNIKKHLLSVYLLIKNDLPSDVFDSLTNEINELISASKKLKR